MIVRWSEATVVPALREEFLSVLVDLVGSFPTRFEGLVSHEVVADRADPTRVSYISRWASETALVAFAGENWATDAVTFPDEDRYLTKPLELRHFTVLD